MSQEYPREPVQRSPCRVSRTLAAPLRTLLSARPCPGARRPHSPLVVGFHPDLVGAVPAEAAPKAARSRHGAAGAAVPLCRHSSPAGPGEPQARSGGAAGSGRAVAAAARPPRLQRAPPAPGSTTSGDGRGLAEAAARRSTKLRRAARESSAGFPLEGRSSRPESGRAAAPPPRDAGVSPGRVPPRSTWALSDGTPHLWSGMLHAATEGG